MPLTLLKAFRQANGRTQSQMAAELGIDRTWLSRLENGLVLPTPAQAKKKIQGRPLHELLEPVQGPKS